MLARSGQASLPEPRGKPGKPRAASRHADQVDILTGFGIIFPEVPLSFPARPALHHFVAVIAQRNYVRPDLAESEGKRISGEGKPEALGALVMARAIDLGQIIVG